MVRESVSSLRWHCNGISSDRQKLANSDSAISNENFKLSMDTANRSMTHCTVENNGGDVGNGISVDSLFLLFAPQ